MRKILQLAFCLPLLAHGAGLVAQTVGGQVVDSKGQPIRGAIVRLLDSALVVLDSASLDSTGTFYVAGARPGMYRLRFDAPGITRILSKAFRLERDEFHQERFVINVLPNERVYFDFQVSQQVTPIPGNASPRYPAALRSERVEGEVLVQFVVGSSGRPVAGTTKVLRSSHPDFTEAVLAVLPSFRFNPAQVGGHAVAQLVQMPFQFNIAP